MQWHAPAGASSYGSSETARPRNFCEGASATALPRHLCEGAAAMRGAVALRRGMTCVAALSGAVDSAERY